MIEGTHFVREDESDLRYDVNTIIGMVLNIMDQAGTPMSEAEVISRI